MNAAKAVSEEVAKQEVDKWLDFRRVRRKKREENESSIKDMVEAFEEGILILDHKTHVIKQTLIFETAGKKEFNFKPSMSVGDGQRRLKGIKSGDHQLMLSAYVAELTGEASEVIRQMNTEDYGISRTIAGFFF
jgi:hypothetical protein